jgi:hypothetical protein
MAGLGRRTFQAGEVLTASNVMAYLQDQSVQVYAGTAARGSAIGTAVSQGMASYLKDTNAIEFYDGSAWKKIYSPTGVAGSIVQVVSTTKTDTFSLASATMTDVTGLSLSITPKSASNKVFVMVNMKATSAVDQQLWSQLVRNSTAISVGDAAGSRRQTSSMQLLNYTDSNYNFNEISISYLDSPATTSATTYKMQVATASGTMYVNRSVTDNDNNAWARVASTITAFEVAA